MRLTMRSDYGAHAVIELARRYGQGPVQCADIAAQQRIPEAYLDQLLASLRRAGIIRSQRGPHGGHELARDPHELTLGDVVTALEGPVIPQDFVHTPDSDDGGPGWIAACGVRDAWLAAAEASQRVLDQTTIRQLAERQDLIRARRRTCSQGILVGNGGSNALVHSVGKMTAAPQPGTRSASAAASA